jgi:RND family efflux transporter MFP subunit
MSKWKVILPVLIIVIGAASFYLFVKYRKQPPKRKVVYKGPLVSVTKVRAVNEPLMIEGYGTVQPEHTLDLVPQVSGKVVMVSKNFIDGSFVKKGEVLVRIERSDYEIALKRAEANLLNRDVTYKKALKQAHIAKKEWEEILNNVLENKQVVPDALTLYLPQLKAAKAAYDAAQADVRLARLNLERTTLKAPYDARVLRRVTDIGQFVMPGKSLGSLFSIEEADVVVPLNPQDVAWLKVPAEAEVISTLTGKPVRFPARLVRTTGRIDPKSRMLHAVVKVERPYGSKPPLQNGDFVTVYIKGKQAEGFWISAKAERDGKVWVAREGRLRIRKVRVLYREAHRVLVSGLEDGDLVITTSLFAVTDGMKIRVRKAGKK